MIKNILVTDNGTEDSEVAEQMNVLLILFHVMNGIGKPASLI
jgi:hypothetical protein